MSIVGQRKVGKTSLIGDLTRSLLTGEAFLGRFEVVKVSGTVAILNYEVSGWQAASWLNGWACRRTTYSSSTCAVDATQ